MWLVCTSHIEEIPYQEICGECTKCTLILGKLPGNNHYNASIIRSITTVKDGGGPVRKEGRCFIPGCRLERFKKKQIQQ